MQRFVEVFDQNRKTWRHKIKEQAPQLTSLYCGRIVTSNHRRCSLKKLFLKISQYPPETSVLTSLFKKVAGLKTCIFIKKKSQGRCFPVNIATYFEKYLRPAAFDCFNGSLLHETKGSRYDVGRRQASVSESQAQFFFLCRHLSCWTESEKLRLKTWEEYLWWAN